MMKKEIRGLLGQASSMDIPLTKNELLQTVEFMSQHGMLTTALKYLVMVLFQLYHIIGQGWIVLLVICWALH